MFPDLDHDKALACRKQNRRFHVTMMKVCDRKAHNDAPVSRMVSKKEFEIIRFQDLSRNKSDDLSSDLARERGIYEITLSE